MPLHPGQAAAGAGFLPHGFCYLWNRALLVTHLTSDLAIGLSYVAISISLVVLVRRARHEIPFSPLFLAFGLFIVACGMTHFMEVWTLWHPTYWLAGGVKVVTAVASVAVAAVMPFTIPRVLVTIHDAHLSRERALAAERAAAMEESNALLHAQATELEEQRASAQALASELAQRNTDLQTAMAAADKARKAAQAADVAKSEFLTVMSHELRTPLNAVVGYGELLSMEACGPVTADQHEKLARMRRSADHLLMLINQVLDFERIAAGREETFLEATEIGDLLRETAAEVEPQAVKKGLTLAIEPLGGPAIVVTDAAKLRQILLNLLSNAVKYTDRGEIRVSARQDDGVLELSVRDTGIGIKPEDRERVFDPFWQADQRLTRKVGGTGLGLSIVHRLTQLLRGEVTVCSTPGRGSTFTVRLPLAPLVRAAA